MKARLLRSMAIVTGSVGSHPHRHQHVQRAGRVLIAQERGGAGIRELQLGLLALELRGDVEEIAAVEADIERIRVVFDLELLGGAAGIGIGDR